MVGVRTSEECAKSLLTVFRDFKTHIGETVPRSQLEAAFHSAGGGGADYEAAMLCAIERHWIKVENDAARLTDSGSAAAGPSDAATGLDGLGSIRDDRR